jgi:O-antigen/teichoic acid export membrane protein
MLINEKTGGNSVAAALSTAVNVALGLVLVAAHGIWGAAVGSFIAAVIFTSLLLWLSQRQVDIHFDIRHALGLGMIFVATSVSVLLLYEYSTNHSAIARTALLALCAGHRSLLDHDSHAAPCPVGHTAGFGMSTSGEAK